METRTYKSYTSPRRDILKLIHEPPRRVLDVGCSNGALSAELKKRFPNAHVTGLENEKTLIQEAQKNVDRVIAVDLDKPEDRALATEVFDLLIFADVLEHTKEPQLVLKELLRYASADAKILISLPNVQHWTTFYELASGAWPERDRGLFDRTHLRWFTKRKICALASGCGLSIVSLHRNYRILDRPGGKVNRWSKYASHLPFKNFLTYQYLVVLKVSPPKAR